MQASPNSQYSNSNKEFIPKLSNSNNAEQPSETTIDKKNSHSRIIRKTRGKKCRLKSNPPQDTRKCSQTSTLQQSPQINERKP